MNGRNLEETMGELVERTPESRFPCDEPIARLCSQAGPELLGAIISQFHLTGPRALAFVLKAMWERFLAEPEKEDPDLASEKRSKDGQRFEFIPDPGQLLSVSRAAPNAGFPADPETLLRLCREIILNDLHRAGLFSPETERYISLAEEEWRLEAHSPPDMVARHRGLRNLQVTCRWNLERSLFTLEKRRIRDQILRARWMAIFGEEYKQRERASEELKELEIQIGLLETDPGLTEQQLEERTAEQRKATQQHLRTIEIETSLGIFLRKNPLPTLPPAEIAEWESKMKKALFRVWKIIHPDVLERHPRFARLSQGQLRQIEDLRHRLSQMKSTDLSGATLSEDSRHEFLEMVEAMAQKVEKTLQNAGIDLDAELLPPPGSIADRVAWLEKEVHRLESGIRNANYRLEQLRRDPFMGEIRACLNRPELHETFRKNLCSQIEVIEARAKELREEREALLEGRASTADVPHPTPVSAN